MPIEKPKMGGKQIAVYLVFFVSSSVAQLSLSLRWPGWIVWALLPLIAFSGVMLMIPMFKAVRKHDEAARSGQSLGGTRFSRTLPSFVEVTPIVATWAEKHGYKAHASSTLSKAVYLRVPFGMMPVFVAVESLESVVKIEAWIVAPTGREEGLTSGFSVRIPNWIGVSNVNKLLAELKQPPVEKLKK